MELIQKYFRAIFHS